MKAFTVFTSSVVIWSMVSCSGFATKSKPSAAFYGINPSETYEIKATTGANIIGMTSVVPLANATVISKNGWLFISFETMKSGTAKLSLKLGDAMHEELMLTLSPGESSIVIDPSHKIMKTGHLSGTFSRECGPQGARCSVEIANVSGLSFPCGSQGAACRIAELSTQNQSESYICGPQGATCSP